MSINRVWAVSHVGKVRSNNQDSAYAGKYLFVVADGMGGHAGGDVASALTVTFLRELDREYETAEAAAQALTEGLLEANTILARTVVDHPELTGMGTTVSAMIRVGDRLAFAHIGDSRIYRLRDGELTQISTDHTFVQRLVETGRITPEQAITHPRRSVLMRVLGDVDASPEIDSWIADIEVGDRWMLCSDGLSGVVSHDHMQSTLTSLHGTERAAQVLLQQSLSAGAPDNVTIVLLDVDELSPGPVAEETITVGSAAAPVQLEKSEPATRVTRIPSLRLHPVRPATGPTHFEPQAENFLDELIEENARRTRRRRLTWIISAAVVLIALILGIFLGYQWTQSRFFVGESSTGYVTIFRGVQQDLGPLKLSHVYETSSLRVDELPSYEKGLVQSTINAESLQGAQSIVKELTSVSRQ